MIDTYEAVYFGDFGPDCVAAQGLRILFNVARKRDLQAFLQRVCGVISIFDLTGQLEDLFAHRRHFSWEFLVGVRRFDLDLKKVPDQILVILACSLQGSPERT